MTRATAAAAAGTTGTMGMEDGGKRERKAQEKEVGLPDRVSAEWVLTSE